MRLLVKAAAGQTGDLQQWQDSTGKVLSALTSSPVDGTKLSLPTATGKPFRLHTWEQVSPDTLMDRLFTITYNRSKQGLTWARDDPTREAMGFQLESWWNGNVQLNLDLQAPDGTEHRALGLAAAYSGSQLVFAVGTGMYATGAGGVQLCGGTIADHRQLRIYELAGGTPRLLFALAGSNAVGMGNYGIFKFQGAFATGEPIFHFNGVGLGAVVLNAYPNGGLAPQYQLWAGGKREWGPGSAVADVNLYRLQANVLTTDKQLRAAGGLVPKVKAGAPTDGDFKNPVDGAIVIDTAGSKIWVRIAGVWRSASFAWSRSVWIHRAAPPAGHPARADQWIQAQPRIARSSRGRIAARDSSRSA